MDDLPDPDAHASSRPKVIEALKASQLKDIIQQFGEALRARRKGIDDLNVYPVPDGDTGTNMSLTVASVVAELKNAAKDDMHSVSSAISKGAIMGARGNSGAILAQALRGIAESVKEKSSISPVDLAEALERARKSAYESVLKPVEGTILTVLTAAAEAAKKSADSGHKLAEQLEHVRTASAEALARTPDLLPVLKQAGVVDAGGTGLLLLVDALRYVATGEPIPGVTDALGITDPPEFEQIHSELSDLRWEVMFLMDAADDGIPQFRQKWSEVGDSIVVVGGDGLWNCHIHSDDSGAAIETALAFGKPRDIRITDLQEQAAHVHETKNVESAETAVVAVINGEGLNRIYESLGVQEIVGGGQSMNPSVAELLEAANNAPSNGVILLPNNKNIIAAANQVNDLTEKSVEVVATTSIVEGMAALFAYDSSKSVSENAEAMRDAALNIVCGEVTQAVRKSESTVGPIKKDDWLGIGPDGISVVASSMEQALCELVETMAGDDHEVLTLIEGEGASADTTEALQTWITKNRPGIEVEIQLGGQALYPYLIGLE